MADDDVTAADLLAISEGSRSQLSRWTDMGLIPPPVTVPGPSGRGRRSLWPRAVLDTVRLIAEHSKRGVPLFRIGQHVHELRTQDRVQRVTNARASAQALLTRWRTPRRGTTGDHQTLIDILREAAATRLQDAIGLDATISEKLAVVATLDDVLLQVLTLWHLGMEPVLLFNPKAAVVFAIGSVAVSAYHSPAAYERLSGTHGEPGFWPGFVTLRFDAIVEAVRAELELPDVPLLVPAPVVEQLDRTQQSIVMRYELEWIYGADGNSADPVWVAPDYSSGVVVPTRPPSETTTPPRRSQSKRRPARSKARRAKRK